MRAGIAYADITPDPGEILQGHWSDNPSHSVLYPLEVRAIVFEQNSNRLAIVAADALATTAELTRRIRRQIEDQTGIKSDHVMLACSHTHCGPPMLNIGNRLASSQFAYRIESAAIRCVVEAAEGLEPVTLGLGGGSSHFNINRRPWEVDRGMTVNYAGIVDRRVRVLRVDGAGGAPLAVLFHYCCHPTTKSGREGYISADYPGIARTIVERTLNCKAMFMPGCFGNIRPAILGENGSFTSATKEQLDACGSELGDEVCRVSKWLRTGQFNTLLAKTAPLELRYGEPKPPAELNQLASRGKTSMERAQAMWACRVREMIAARTMPATRLTHMQLARIGPVLVVSIPGEPVQEIGHAIEKEGHGALEAEDIWPVGYTNDMVGYLCTPEQHAIGGYEPNAYFHFGSPARFAGEAETIVQVARRLFERSE